MALDLSSKCSVATIFDGYLLVFCLELVELPLSTKYISNIVYLTSFSGIHVVEGEVLTKNGSCGNIGEFFKINENEEIGNTVCRTLC